MDCATFFYEERKYFFCGFAVLKDFFHGFSVSYKRAQETKWVYDHMTGKTKRERDANVTIT